jgi:hypothetical protein
LEVFFALAARSASEQPPWNDPQTEREVPGQDQQPPKEKK